MKKEKLLIVQPHSDDALLSCSHCLLTEGYEVQVLTVECDPKRIAEDEKLYDFLGIPFHHLNVEYIDNSYYAFREKYKDVTIENSYEFLRNYAGKDTLAEIEYELIEFVRKFFKKNKGYTLMAPWGIGHPFHLFVRDVLEQSISIMQYYREFPHSYKKRAQAQIERMTEGGHAYTLKKKVEITDFADVKWKLASKFYRTQSGLLFYEQSYVKKNLPEEVYVKDDLPF